MTKRQFSYILGRAPASQGRHLTGFAWCFARFAPPGGSRKSQFPYSTNSHKADIFNALINFSEFMFRIFIFIFFYLFSFSLRAQVTVKGKVIDNDTEEGIPFANVYLLRDPQTGTSTDVDGYFEVNFK